MEGEEGTAVGMEKVTISQMPMGAGIGGDIMRRMGRLGTRTGLTFGTGHLGKLHGKPSKPSPLSGCQIPHKHCEEGYCSMLTIGLTNL